MKAGWETRKIGDVCDVMTGGTPSKSKPQYFGGDIKWLVSGDIHQQVINDCEGRITEEGLNNSNAKFLPVNSVMMALNGQGKTRGSVALLRTKATCNQSLVSISPKDTSKLLPEFLYLNLQWRYQEIRTITGDSGNDRRGLNMIIIRNIEVPVPPVSYQQRIVGILDKAFEDITKAVANAEANLNNARGLFESRLNAVFSNPTPDCSEKKLVSVCELFTDGNWIESKDQSSEGIRLVQTGNIGIGEFKSREEKARYISEETFQRLKCTEIFSGDCLVSRLPDPVGRACIIPEANEKMITAVDCTIIRFRKEVLPKYFCFYSQSSGYLRDVDTLTTGTTRKRISRKNLGSVLLPVPPVNKQQTIVAKLEELAAETKRLEAIYRQKLALMTELKQSLLHRAFSGAL